MRLHDSEQSLSISMEALIPFTKGPRVWPGISRSKEHGLKILIVANALGNYQEETWKILRSVGVHVVPEAATEKVGCKYRVVIPQTIRKRVPPYFPSQTPISISCLGWARRFGKELTPKELPNY
jgi:hypothetical protein